MREEWKERDWGTSGGKEPCGGPISYSGPIRGCMCLAGLCLSLVDKVLVVGAEGAA